MNYPATARTFTNPLFGEIRTVTIDNEPWFVGKDVAAALGYSDTFGALKKHVDDEDKQNCQNDSFDSPRGMTIINESGLYSLILASKLPKAKNFKRWVTSVVLPTIRKTGFYSMPDADAKDFVDLIQGRGGAFSFCKLPDRKRMARLDSLAFRTARKLHATKNRALYAVYRMTQREFGVSLDAYLEVYRAETGMEDASTFQMFTCNDRFYEYAVRLFSHSVGVPCEFDD